MIAQVSLPDFLRSLQEVLTQEFRLVLAIGILLISIILGVGVARILSDLFKRFGVPSVVEGTPFERSAQRFGTSTITLVSQLLGLFIIIVGSVFALRLVGFLAAEVFVARLADFAPNFLVAAIVVIVGLVLGGKAEVATSERLRSVKLPEVTLVPTLVKFSIFYVAFLVALAQLGVMVSALLVLLAAYSFGVFFLGGLALKDMLSSATAGIYLLLTEPYTIGDEIRIDGHGGIVQEIDIFVTHIESENEEHIVPNRYVFEQGIVRSRDD